MGIVADTMLEAGGQVIGVIPAALVQKEVAHEGLSDLRIVSSMHERKAQMATLADGFVALPGGMGTLEEPCEILTWAQLGMHDKPCGLLNVCGYYTGLLQFLAHAVEERFLKAVHQTMLIVEETPHALLDWFATHQAPTVEKWIDRGQA